MDDIEVSIYLEDRCIAADIRKDGSLVDLKAEFDLICKDDEALSSRRKEYAPTFSLIIQGEKKEIKRKFRFEGGEKENNTNSFELPTPLAPQVVQVEMQLSPAASSSNGQAEGTENDTVNASDDLRHFVESDLSPFGTGNHATPLTRNTVNMYLSSSNTTDCSQQQGNSDEEDSPTGSASEHASDGGRTVLITNDTATNATNKKRKKLRSEYRKPSKKIRSFDETINVAKSLPNFSTMLKRNLKNGKINKRHLLAEIRLHMEGETKDKYSSSDEMDLISEALIREYPALADPDSNFQGSRVIRHSIQKSWATKRYNDNEKAEKERQSHPQLRPTTSLRREDPPPVATPDKATLVLELKSGCRDRNRLKWLIQHTYQDRISEFKLSEDKLRTITSYPHLKEGRVMFFEYSLMIKIDARTMEENCKELLNTLSNYLGIPLLNVDSALEILKEIQEQLVPRQIRKQKLRRGITFQDALQVDRRTLEQHNTVQAPCIVATVSTTKEGKRALTTSVLIMHDDVINIVKDPTVEHVLIQFLAPYWLYDIKYPRAYESFLRLMERFLHGELSSQTKKTRPKQEYTSLIRAFEN